MKRFLSSSLCLSLLLSTMGITFWQVLPAQAQVESLFIDVDTTHEFVSDINYLKENNIVEGYEIDGQVENQFRADYELNRAELTKIMVEAQYSQEEIDACLAARVANGDTTVEFPDVPIDAWYAKYICIAVEKGILEGYPDGTFKPSEPVNFAEAAKIITNTIGLAEGTDEGAWFVPFIEALQDREGIPDSIRSFAKRITRGEMARMIHAAKEDIEAESLTLATLEVRNTRADELPQIESCNALIEKLELDQDMMPTGGVLRTFDTMNGAVDMEESEAPMAPGDDGAGSSGAVTATATQESTADDSAGEFSSTNVQVRGVDEADIVKNDGKHIYLIKGDTIRIVEAYPAQNLSEVATIELDDEDFTPQEMYVDEDQMVIIGSVWRQRKYPRPFAEVDTLSRMAEPAIGIWPGPSFNENRMKVYVYDISDRANPVKERSVEIEGNYSNSRKVGKNVYFVINQWIPYYQVQTDQPADIIIPRFKDSATDDVERPLVRCTGIQYFPRFQDRNYLIVAGLNIADSDSRLNRNVLIGNSQNVYASRENLYVATPFYGESLIEDGDDLIYDSESQTRVYRFAMNAEQIEYQNQGIVPGNILNQFSMDESNNTFRIATTRDFYDRSEDEYVTNNNLYILATDQEDMNIIGEVTNIAPGERIKSMRFMGNRGYMVTFKNVDPLFVIDLENPRNPTILGELKIPGWSDYLHPYDENHLLGFGREVDPAAEDAEFLTSEFLLGMKLSIFDVSDVANPKEIHKEVIGQRGTTSELLNNHKALLFDKSKDLLAFPITITELIDPDEKPDYGNIQTTFAGGVIYDVNLEDGFTQRGKVTHYEDDSIFEDAGEWFYGEFGRNIQRMLYIGEYLYSVSPDFVRSYELESGDSINFIKLSGPRSDDVDYIDDVLF